MTQPAADVVLGGRYRLIDRLASGGMGTVWVADDEVLGRKVAVKVLNDALADEDRFIARFHREAQAAAGLSHPNVGGIYDYGEEDGRPYIVMELLEGETLDQRLSRTGRLDPAEAARIGADVADALTAAHEAGIVHRDVKPGNVMLSPRGHVDVMDFGIASTALARQKLTSTGTILGTARYLSPEQAAGQPATPASDVYSLGVLLYEMLTGAPPFERDTPVATAMAHVSDPPPPLEERRPDVPRSLAELVEACLAKDPRDRPASAASVAAGLRTMAAPDPTDPGINGVAARVGVASAASLAGSAGIQDGTATAPIEPAPATARLPATAPSRLPHPSGRAAPRRSVLPWVLAAAIAAGALLATFLIVRASGLVTVPSFVGKTQSEATAAAERRGLQLSFTSTESDQTKGTVIRQVPEAKARVPKGTAVTLVLSSGPKLVAVPSLSGVSPEAVPSVLSAEGLRFGGVRPVADQPFGFLGTDPPEGKFVPVNTEVFVLFGTGERTKGHGKDKKGNGEGD